MKNIFKIKKNNQYYQHTIYSCLNKFNIERISKEYPIKYLNLQSEIPMSELNMVKGMRYALLKSFLQAKVRFNKDLNNLFYKFNNYSLNNISNLIEFVLFLNNNKAFISNNNIIFTYQDILLNLRNLDFQKVSPESLKNIKITFYMIDNKQIQMYLINEVFRTKR